MDNLLYQYSNLQEYYSLKGGKEIPNGADLYSETYKIPGNYYCVSNANAQTLINCPVLHAFVLKVDFSTGTGYPRQTFYTLENSIVLRTYDLYNQQWSYLKEIALNSNLLYKLTVKALGQTNSAHDVVINGTIDYQTYFLFGQKGLVCSANPMASGTPQFGGNIPEGFTIYQIGTDARKLYIAYPAYTSVYACSFYDFTITQKN